MSTFTLASIDRAKNLDSFAQTGCFDSHSGSIGHGEITQIN